ncbi:hypothetical protein Save01_08462 [Streptomyces avermitilis]
MGVVRAGGATGPDSASRWWPTAVWGSRGAGRDCVRGHVRVHMEAVTTVLWSVGADRAPPVQRMEQGAGLGQTAPPGAGRTRRSRRPGLVEVCNRLGEHAGPERGDLTGPNPVDRGKKGSKIHLITERTGLPISVGISGANLHDSQPCSLWSAGSRRYAPAAAHADASPPSCTPTRATTMTTCGDGCVNAASPTALHARASNPLHGWAAIAGRSSALWPGSPTAVGSTAATSARQNTS